MKNKTPLEEYLWSLNVAREFNGDRPYDLRDCKSELVYMELFKSMQESLIPEEIQASPNVTIEQRQSIRDAKVAMLEGAWKELQVLAGVEFSYQDRRILDYDEGQQDCPICGYTAYKIPNTKRLQCLNCGEFEL